MPFDASLLKPIGRRQAPSGDYWRSNFNTELSPDQESEFQQWVAEESKRKGRDVLKDLNDYDLRGYWSSGPTGGSHGPDRFKKPNHPTFSNESKYHGGEWKGGEWVGDEASGMSFRPSREMLRRTHSIGDMQRYFREHEPGVKLIQPKTGGFDPSRLRPINAPPSAPLSDDPMEAYKRWSASRGTPQENQVWRQEMGRVMDRRAAPPEAERGIIGRFGVGARHPIQGQATAYMAATQDDETLKNYLLAAQKDAQHQHPEDLTFSEKAAEIGGGLFTTLAQIIPAAAITRNPRAAVAGIFGTMEAGNAFSKAGIRALNEGKTPDEALAIAKDQAKLGGALGAGSAFGFPMSKIKRFLPKAWTRVPSSVLNPRSWVGRRGLGPSYPGHVAKVSGTLAGLTAGVNVGERAHGLETPIMEGVPQAAAMGLGLVTVPYAGGAALRRMVTPRATPPPPAEGAPPPTPQPPGAPPTPPGRAQMRPPPMPGRPAAPPPEVREPGRVKMRGRQMTPEQQKISEQLQREADELKRLEKETKPYEKEAAREEDAYEQAEREAIDAGEPPVVNEAVGTKAPEVDLLAGASAYAKQKGLESRVRVVDEMPPGEQPFGLQEIALPGRDGRIYFNRSELGKFLEFNMKGATREQIQTAINAKVAHEGIHLRVLDAIPDAELASLWNERLTGVERWLAGKSYAGKKTALKSGELGWGEPHKMGHEYIRRVISWAENIPVDEVASAVREGWLSEKAIDLSLKGIHKARTALGTKTSKEVASILNRAESNLNAAKKALAAQDRPASQRQEAAEEKVTRRVPAEIPNEPAEALNFVREMFPESLKDMRQKWNEATQRNRTGITEFAYEMGNKFKSPEDIAALKEWHARVSPVVREKVGKLPIMERFEMVSLSQLADEVLQGALKERPTVKKYLGRPEAAAELRPASMRKEAPERKFFDKLGEVRARLKKEHPAASDDYVNMMAMDEVKASMQQERPASTRQPSKQELDEAKSQMRDRFPSMTEADLEILAREELGVEAEAPRAAPTQERFEGGRWTEKPGALRKPTKEEVEMKRSPEVEDLIRQYERKLLRRDPDIPDSELRARAIEEIMGAAEKIHGPPKKRAMEKLVASARRSIKRDNPGISEERLESLAKTAAEVRWSKLSQKDIAEKVRIADEEKGGAFPASRRKPMGEEAWEDKWARVRERLDREIGHWKKLEPGDDHFTPLKKIGAWLKEEFPNQSEENLTKLFEEALSVYEKGKKPKPFKASEYYDKTKPEPAEEVAPAPDREGKAPPYIDELKYDPGIPEWTEQYPVSPRFLREHAPTEAQVNEIIPTFIELGHTKKSAKDAAELVALEINLDKAWQKDLNKVRPIYNRIKEEYPNLSENELRAAALEERRTGFPFEGEKAFPASRRKLTPGEEDPESFGLAPGTAKFKKVEPKSTEHLKMLAELESVIDDPHPKLVDYYKQAIKEGEGGETLTDAQATKAAKEYISGMQRLEMEQGSPGAFAEIYARIRSENPELSKYQAQEAATDEFMTGVMYRRPGRAGPGQEEMDFPAGRRKRTKAEGQEELGLFKPSTGEPTPELELPKATGQGELTLPAGAPKAPIPEGELGEVLPKAYRPVTPENVGALAERVVREDRNPSFKRFVAQTKSEFGTAKMKAGQILEVWRDRVWGTLMDMTGREREGLRNRMGLLERLGAKEYTDEVKMEARRQAQAEAEASLTKDKLMAKATRMEEKAQFKENQIKKLIQLWKLTKPGTAERLKADAAVRSQQAEVKDLRRKASNLSRITRTAGEAALPKLARAALPEQYSKTSINDIAKLGMRLLGREGLLETGLRRKKITPEDIGWKREKEGIEPAYRKITKYEAEQPEIVSKIATSGARVDASGKGAPNQTVSKRVLAVLDKQDGRVELLGVYKTSPGKNRPVLYFIVDPGKAMLGNQRVHSQMTPFFNKRLISGERRYQPLDSFMLDEPVEFFRQTFKDVDTYREQLRNDVKAEAGRPSVELGEAEPGGPRARARQETPLEEGLGKFEEGLTEEGEVIPYDEPAPGEMPGGRPLMWKKGPIKDAEVRRLYDYLAPEGEQTTMWDIQTSLERLFEENRIIPETAKPRPLSANELGVVDALVKARDMVRARNPGMSEPAALGKVLQSIHETATSEKATRQTFIDALVRMGEESQRGTEPAGKAAPEAEAFGRELEAPISRRPPTASTGAIPEEGKFLAPAPPSKSPGPGRSYGSGRDMPASIRNITKSEADLRIRDIIPGTLRYYSEWMVERLERAGGPAARTAARLFNRIINAEKRNYGELTDVLDPALEAAGKNNAATKWINDIDTVTPDAAISRAPRAIEGTIDIPTMARPLVELARAANLRIGQLYEAVTEGFKAVGAWQRNLTPFGYDLIRKGRGKVWERYVQGTAVANKVPYREAELMFLKMKRIYDEPSPSVSRIEKVNQDFKRLFPKAITHVKVNTMVGTKWEPVIHSHLYRYLESAARRAAHVRAFREGFGFGRSGEANARPTRLLNAMNRAVRAELDPSYQKDYDAAIRGMQGHPSDNYAGMAILAPDMPVGATLRMFNQTVGNLMAKMVLTGQMAVQVGETLAGSTPVFLGWQRYIRAMAQLMKDGKQIYQELERAGARNRVIYDFSKDPSAPLRAAFRRGGNRISKTFMEQWLNELQEGSAAATARLAADDIAAGRLTAWDRRMLQTTMEKMGFSKSQAAEMMQAKDGQALRPDLLDQFVNKASAWLTSGNKSIAQGSRLGASRLFNSMFRFQSYAMAKTNQLRKIGEGWADAADAVRKDNTQANRQRLVNESALLTKFLFGNVLQGTLTMAVTALAYEKLFGVDIRVREAAQEPYEFATEAFLASMSGPLYLLWRAKDRGGLAGVGEQVTRAFFPYEIVRNMTDAALGTGHYRDLTPWGRLGKFVQQKVPATKAISAVMSIGGLGWENKDLETSQKAFYRWRFKKMGRGGAPPDTEEYRKRRMFRTHMKRAATLMKQGKLDEVHAAIAKAAESPDLKPGSIVSSLNARKILKSPNLRDLGEDELADLEKHIGPKALEMLHQFDAMIDALAEVYKQ